MEDVGMSPEFWKGKKVFITGHTGFKGSWLCLWLEMVGADVTGYALDPDTSPSLYKAANIGKGVQSIIADIRDKEKLVKAITDASPDIVIHMAAQSLVRYSYHHPVETYEVNVMGTVHVLEAVRTCKSVKAVLIVTSDKCYENRERMAGYREDEAMGGYDTYSSSKGCAELVVSAYRQSFFSSGEAVAIATARAGNVIGGGDWCEDRLIPDMVRSFSSEEAVTIRNPNAIRPWQHVFDALNGYLILLENMVDQPKEYSEAWNFGPNDKDAKPVAWLVEQFSNHWGNATWLVEKDSKTVHEAHTLSLNSSKARTRLDWTPLMQLENALELIARWYKCYYDGGDVALISQNHLENYTKYLDS